MQTAVFMFLSANKYICNFCSSFQKGLQSCRIGLATGISEKESFSIVKARHVA